MIHDYDFEDADLVDDGYIFEDLDDGYIFDDDAVVIPMFEDRAA